MSRTADSRTCTVCGQNVGALESALVSSQQYALVPRHRVIGYFTRSGSSGPRPFSSSRGTLSSSRREHHTLLQANPHKLIEQ